MTDREQQAEAMAQVFLDRMLERWTLIDFGRFEDMDAAREFMESMERLFDNISELDDDDEGVLGACHQVIECLLSVFDNQS
jgi:hypothetical protein